MIRILKYLKVKEWLQILISLVFIVIQVWLDLKLPDYMAKITQLVQTPNSDMVEIWIAGGYMLLCALGSLTAAFVVGFFAARIAASFSQRLRRLLFNKVDSFSMEEINNFSIASLITRSTNDITQIQVIVMMGLQLTIKAPIMAVWAITKIAGKGFEWSMATFVALLLMAVVIGLIMLLVLPKFNKMQTLTDNMNRVTSETLSGLRVIRAYNAENYQEEKYEKANKDLTNVSLFTSRVMAFMPPSASFIMNGLSLAIYWIGAILIGQSSALNRLDLFSNMVIFSNYSTQVIMAFMMLIMMFTVLPRASISAKRINEVLNTESKLHYGNQTEAAHGVKGEISFHNVSFKYPEATEYVLKNISFSVKQGETIAFIGSTGSGKSTLVNLIPRFFDPTDGEILVDRINIKDYTEQALNNKIGYVPQKAIMFKGSIYDNVAFGENGDGEFNENDVKEAIAIAQSTDFVEKMEGGYNAAVSQAGTNLSGGQKQRLSIARAICRNPEIYIFDDSFSALDYKTDRVLRDELKKQTTGATSIIVTQRIGTIMNADKIVVLDEGRIVGIGKHKELLETCNVYLEIAKSQLNEEELTK